MESRTNPLGWPTWAWHGLLLLALFFAAYGVAGSVSNLARAAGLLHDLTPTGMVLERPAGTPSGWSRVAAVEPGTAAASAGVRAGDLVRFDNLVGMVTRDRAGWDNPITVARDGERFGTRLVADARADTRVPRLDLALFGVRSLVAIAFGAVLLVRGRANRAAAQLGVILVGLGAATGGLLLWSPNPTLATARLLMPLISATISYFWIMFALEISGGSADPRQARIVRAVAVAFGLATLAAEFALLTLTNVPLAGSPDDFAIALVAANQLVGYLIIAVNYRRNTPPARNRIKIVLIAFVCFMVATVGGRMTLVELTPTSPDVQHVLVRLGLTALTFVGLGLLVYGVLRRSLFDVNFALNRTLVYAAVSFVVLTAFGLAKWVIEHLVPESWHAGSEYYSVGIALGLFLVLHRVHNWVERNVERVLFSPWHRNEEALRRFVASAAHYDRSPALCRAFAEELRRFGQGTEAAIYLTSDDGGFRLQAGKIAGARREYAGGDPAFALMRAERRPTQPSGTHSALPGALALPMLDQGALAGFALVGRKGNGSDYRRDEVESLGWAADQIGLDLQAMKARELRDEIAGLAETVAALRGRVAQLTDERDRLNALLTGQSMSRAEGA